RLISLPVSGQRAFHGPPALAGVIVPGPHLDEGPNGFTLLHASGALVRVSTQPLRTLQGVVADAAGRLWWIEAPQAPLDLWRLWRYDVNQGELTFVLQETSVPFADGGAPRTPELVGLLSGDDGSFWLLLDTSQPQQQRTQTGLYQVRLDGNALGEVRQILPESSYRRPIRLSPDGSRLAHLAYDPQQASLTNGVLRPANQLWVRPVGGAAPANNPATPAYVTETRFEFLAPQLAWQDNQRLILARSRFAPGDLFGLETFGLVQVGLEGPDVVSQSYLLPPGRRVEDFTVCQADGRLLVQEVNKEEGRRLALWMGRGPLVPLVELPETVDRLLACWRAPDRPLQAQSAP
ncbi:MAG: hypothetical protein D6790_08565, partial [Caldilineae bacterium]